MGLRGASVVLGSPSFQYSSIPLFHCSVSHVEFRSEIDLARFWVIGQELGAAFDQHLAFVDDVTTINQPQHLSHAMVRDQNAQAPFLEPAKDLLHFIDRNRVNAAE